AGMILSSCYPTATGVTSQYCELVVRDGTSHRIRWLTDNLTNLGGDFTSGVDIGARYEYDLAQYGRLMFEGDVNWLGAFDNLLAGGKLVHAKGNYDNGMRAEWTG